MVDRGLSRWQLMQQATTRNQQCAKGCLIGLKLAIKAVDRASGRLEKLKCLLNNIKKRAEATEINGKETLAEEPNKMD
mgnify:CR=1 FL=1